MIRKGTTFLKSSGKSIVECINVPNTLHTKNKLKKQQVQEIVNVNIPR